ncbi:MAG: amidohydrolase family protein, partial [Clostridia bacterium]|nr:amidohydrolase family protein [Clostridia bacterium]
QGADIDDIRYLRIFGQAASLGLWVVTHAGDDIGFPGLVRCAPEMVQNAIAQVGDFPLILAHMGGWKNWDRVEQLAETKVYLDTAFSLGAITPIDDHYTTEELQMLSEERFCAIVRAFGAERILFGTDSPWGDQQKTLESIRALPLTAQEKALILGENAKNILKL